MEMALRLLRLTMIVTVVTVGASDDLVALDRQASGFGVDHDDAPDCFPF